MPRRLTLLFVFVLSATLAGSALVAAPGQSQRPGDISPPVVWVKNRGPAEAIPVAIQGALSDQPLRVQVAGAVVTRPQRQGWEYMQLRIEAGQDAAGVLNAAGIDGWETTGLQLPADGGLLVVLKRPR